MSLRRCQELDVDTGGGLHTQNRPLPVTRPIANEVKIVFGSDRQTIASGQMMIKRDDNMGSVFHGISIDLSAISGNHINSIRRDCESDS
jgi:hypothetical protein